MSNIPVVTLIGRQNVGKSTLFNRLIGTKKAIIDSTPGVTRDLVTSNCLIEDIKFKLVDSGGISDDTDITNLLVQKKTKEAQLDSDLIIFVVEAGDPAPIEKEFVYNIRKLNKPLIFVMNKADSPEKDIYINEYYSYGLGEPFVISAAHNRNVPELKDMIYDKLKELIKDDLIHHEDEEDNIKISILGKPNVGKSSLLNKISNKERSIVSSIPGTTRDIVDEIIEYKGKKLVIHDTAGIRRKSKVNEDLEYYSVNRAIKSIAFSDIVFLVIDIMEELSDQDKKIADQIVKKGKGLIILLNKIDLLDSDNDKINKRIENLKYKFPILNYVPIIPVSANSGSGLKKVLNQSFVIYNEIHKRIETSKLNNFIEEITQKYSPSSKKGVLKIFYGTQVSIMPTVFVFFVNKKRLINNNYKQYITNKLRESFGFTGIPITVNFKSKN